MLNDTLRWEIVCAACDWEACVEALVPFSENGSGLINGLWEEYICPDHLEVGRRAVYVVTEWEHGVDIDTAYIRYFSGETQTVPVPKCSVCKRTMQGGQVLNQLPFYLRPQLEIHTWKLKQLENLRRMVAAEQQAVRQEKQTPEQAQSLLEAEVLAIQRFFTGFREQLGLTAPTTLLNEDYFPTSLPKWEMAVKAAIEESETRLQQLQKRQAEEAIKPPASCPKCHNKSVYLRSANLF
ncbi:MAG: hypothetical protein DPW16_17315 [Chloroflexi bacterium]|nr:hypothetical protein [Chloroflexota bacterium]